MTGLQDVQDIIKNNCVDINIESAYLYINYIYLDDKERKFFAQNSHEYLIEQLQINSVTLYSRAKRNNPEKSEPCNSQTSNNTPTPVPNKDCVLNLDYGSNCTGQIIKEHLINLDFYEILMGKLA